jgi:hypothetical protein
MSTKQRLVSNLEGSRWVSLSRLREIKLVPPKTFPSNPPQLVTMWKVVAYVSTVDCFTVKEFSLRSEAIAWLEEFNK